MQLKNESGMIVLLTHSIFVRPLLALPDRIESYQYTPPPMPLASRLPNQVRGAEWQIF
jgi:hypothetical protein